MRNDADELDCSLRAGWCRELLRCYRQYNWLYVEDRLTAPSIQLDDAEIRLGRYDSLRRTISISATHVRRDPWAEVMDTLRHEMAHQYVHDILRVHDEPPHGTAFQRACERLRVAPAARQSCDERVTDAGGAPAAALLDKVSKLLALTQSPNENEAQAAMRKARALLVEHNLETRQQPVQHHYGSRRLGPLRQRHHAWEFQLAAILADWFFVEQIWVNSYDAAGDRRGTVLEVYGTATNLQMAEYIHTYLWRLLPELWQRHKARTGLRSDGDRRSYYSGLLVGFDAKLRAMTAVGTPTGLVLVKDPGARTHLRWMHPRVRTSSGSLLRHNEAFESGQRDGRTITVRKPLESGGTGSPGLLSSGG